MINPQSVLIPPIPPQQQDALQVVDTPMGKKYYLHPIWHTFFSTLTTALQNNFSQEGVIVPNQTTANIQTIVNNIPNNQNKNNTLIVDNQMNQLQVILNGVLKTVTVT